MRFSRGFSAVRRTPFVEIEARLGKVMLIIITVIILSLPVLAWCVGCRLKAMREAEDTNNTGHTGARRRRAASSQPRA
jgi:hypothetical protein